MAWCFSDEATAKTGNILERLVHEIALVHLHRYLRPPGDVGPAEGRDGARREADQPGQRVARQGDPVRRPIEEGRGPGPAVRGARAGPDGGGQEGDGGEVEEAQEKVSAASAGPVSGARGARPA